MANLYIHIPFCKQRCIYCDFYFLTTRNASPPFIHALEEEIKHWADLYGQVEPVETIYFGGGTPSLLKVADVRSILNCLHAHFDTSHIRETTFELNPDDARPDYLAALRQIGIDRLSIGVQSFIDKDLSWMNRAHDKEQAFDVIQVARENGFDNFSIDLIFGLPHQSPNDWQYNLETAFNLQAPHISTYSLTIEPRTPLFKQIQNDRMHPIEDDIMAAYYRTTIDYFVQNGYEHYEVSSFAQPGFRSIHNQSYWSHKNYIGLGPSAHSFWKNDDTHAIRWANARSLKSYTQWPDMGTLPMSKKESISLEQLADEYIMLRLRTSDGVNLRILKERYGYDMLATKDHELARLQERKLIQIDTEKSHLTLTREGLLICDAITGDLLG